MDDAKFWSRLQALVDDHGSEGAFHKLCNLYVAAAPAQRDQLRALVNLADHTWSIPMDSTLVDGTVHEFPPEQRIRANLIFHSIENARHDFRDNLISIALIYHSAVETGMDVEGLFLDVAAMSAPEMAQLLASFPRREPADRSLAAFGHRAVRTATGVKYVYIA